jgi:hypothetical protein
VEAANRSAFAIALEATANYNGEALLGYAIAWTLCWISIFYTLAWTSRWWMKTQSTKEEENSEYWMARQMVGVLHAIIISVLSVPVLIGLIVAPDYAKFPYAHDLGQCKVVNSTLTDWLSLYPMIALAGLIFTTFTVGDVIVSVIHGLATWDYYCHHAAFIVAGTIIRTNCMLPFNASILMAMEVSTPFLNYMLLVRNRGDSFQLASNICGVFFFFSYVVSRLILNTYGTIILWTNSIPLLTGASSSFHAMPLSVPLWQVIFLLVAVTAGSVVQFFWFPKIWKMFVRGMRSVMARQPEYVPMPEGEC